MPFRIQCSSFLQGQDEKSKSKQVASGDTPSMVSREEHEQEEQEMWK